jgi:hypothetical protein
MTALTTIERPFGDSTVRFLERTDGTLWMTRDELARCLGYAEADGIAKLTQRHSDEIGGLKGAVKLSTPGGAQAVVIYEERALYLLACLARTEKAAAFRAWVVSTCHDLRTRDKVLVSREEWDQQRDLSIQLLAAYEQQAEAMRSVASAAGRILALRRQSKPKIDPRQLLFDGVTFHEIEATPETSAIGEAG